MDECEDALRADALPVLWGRRRTPSDRNAIILRWERALRPFLRPMLAIGYKLMSEEPGPAG
jgi:hypothetical protein